jgi:hypothetical protein
VRFASREWLAAVVAALNRHPDLPAALSGLGRDAALVVEPDRGWPASSAVYGTHEGGRIATFRLLADEDDVLEIEPAYVLRAPYGVWRELLQGADPVRAALSGRVRVEGDLEALVRRVGYRHVVDAALAAVPTELPGPGEG